VPAEITLRSRPLEHEGLRRVKWASNDPGNCNRSIMPLPNVNAASAGIALALFT